jgi:hypothetical protein
MNKSRYLAINHQLPTPPLCQPGVLDDLPRRAQPTSVVHTEHLRNHARVARHYKPQHID